MSFLRDCWDSMRGIVRDCMTTPLSRKKLYIFGGVFVAVILLVIILVFTLHGSSTTVTQKGSDALKDGLFISGPLGSSWLKVNYRNDIFKNKDAISTALQKNYVFNAKNLGVSPRMSEGGYDLAEALQIWSVGASNCSAASQKDAVSQTLEGIDAVDSLISAVGELKMVTDSNAMRSSQSDQQVGIILAVDGGYTIDSRLAVLRMYYRLGVRILTVTGKCSTPWAADVKSDATNKDLTGFGKNVVKEAIRLGMVVDLTGSFAQVIKSTLDLVNTSAPVLFNGVGADSLTKNETNLGNDTLSSLKGKRATVLVSFKCDLIKNAKGNCTIDEVINHINLIADLIGRNYVGIAGDFGDSSATYPSNLKNITDIATLFNMLHDKGWTYDELRGLAFNNFLNLLGDSPKQSTVPIEDLEPEQELTNGGKEMVCYSDMSIRYPNTPQPTPAPAVNNSTKPALNSTSSTSKKV